MNETAKGINYDSIGAEEQEQENAGSAEIIELDKKRQEKKEDELQERIDQERMEAREQFKNLIDEVSAQYESLSDKDRENFIIHNGKILDGTIDLAIRKGFSKEEIKISELAAILHDMTKADSVPEKYKDIENYTLAMHAKTAAEKVPEILTDDCLKELKVEGDPEEIRRAVSKAILEHMGPRPGFMTYILEEFNKDMKSIGEEGINYPEADGKISEVVLAADMESLASKEGIIKVLDLRSGKENFIDTDLDLVDNYKKYGINLNQGEAALLSAFNSAFQARDMQKDKENQEWINKAIEDSKKITYNFSEIDLSQGKEALLSGLEGTIQTQDAQSNKKAWEWIKEAKKNSKLEYEFSGQKINWQEASEKKRQYEEAKKIEEAREKLENAA